MNPGSSRSAKSLQIARRLIAREAAGNETEPERLAAALQKTCSRVSDNLRDAMGDGGLIALLGRALARVHADHPALKEILRLNEGGIALDSVAASVDAHGVVAGTAAIEALLAALFETLARLIGEDMAERLMDHDPPGSAFGGAHAP